MSNDGYDENFDIDDVEDFQSFEDYYGFEGDGDEPKELEF